MLVRGQDSCGRAHLDRCCADHADILSKSDHLSLGDIRSQVWLIETVQLTGNPAAAGLVFSRRPHSKPPFVDDRFCCLVTVLAAGAGFDLQIEIAH